MRASPNAGPSDDSETFVAGFRSRPLLAITLPVRPAWTKQIFVRGYIHTKGNTYVAGDLEIS
jgi:hypothetical protein